MRLISRKIILEYNEEVVIKSQVVRVGLKFALRILNNKFFNSPCELKNFPRSQT
jgi:hypothetical protein